MWDFEIGYSYILIVVVIVIALYFMTRQPKFNPEPQPQKISGDFTLQQLKQFDGQKKPQTFIAAKGTIYDVTNSQFYQKSGAYGLFAGQDASINLSKMSHDQSLLNKWGNYTLNEDQSKILDDWVARFNQKYRKVGNVIQA